MTPDPLDHTATPDRLHALATAGVLPPRALEEALRRSMASPEPLAWRRFLSVVLLGLGSVLVLSGVVYFFAYNWVELHPFAKLGLLLTVITAACVAAWRLGETLAGQFALLFAAVLVGPLLAVYGQTYQTGADAYELFIGWSLLVLPWVALARFAPRWLWLLLLVNTGLLLFWDQIVTRNETVLGLVLALLNGVAWALHERFAARGVSWLQGRWMPRVLSVMTLVPLTGLAEYVILDPDDLDVFCMVAIALLLATMVAVYVFHRRVQPELFFLTSNALIVMVLATTAAVKALSWRGGAGGFNFFLVGFLIIVEVGISVWWLRVEAGLRREVES